MLETSISAMGWPVSNYLVCGVPPEPMGDQNATAAPSGTFEAADGPLNIAANRQEQFVTLCELLERPDLLDDPRFAEREARLEFRAELNRELNKSLGSRPAAEWDVLLSAAGVPAARILTVPQAVDLPQLDGRGFLTALGDFRVTGSGVLFDGEPLRPPAPPPALGQHNALVPELLARWQR
jgi:crotonobetainyl-CoA:carnitine CoA-transferase CaiB-like acyl-CoA transferase